MNKRIGIFIALVLALGVVLIVVGKLLERSNNASTSYPAPATQIDLKVSSGKVRLVASPLQSIDLKQTNNFVLRSPQVETKFENGRLEVTQECASLNLGRCDSTFELAVPANVAVNVEGGDVDATSLRGELTVKQEGGKFEGNELFGKLDLTSTSGAIELKKITSLEYKAQTTTGKITVDATAQPNNVDLKTESGAISLRLPERPAPYKIDAASGTGKLTLDLKNTPDAQRIVKVQSDSGDINVARTSGN